MIDDKNSPLTPLPDQAIARRRGRRVGWYHARTGSLSVWGIDEFFALLVPANRS
jgi:hypothetical protein